MHAALSFARFRFEPESARLWAGKREIKLTPKAARVLGVLIGRAGEPVIKDTLFAEVWRGTVVSDDALVTCIQELRKALGDDAKQPRYIETRHRYGYCFVAELARTEPAVAARPRNPEADYSDLPAIAVLPFMDMSPSRDQDYFCEGLAEELIDALTHVDGLRVAARSSSFQFSKGGVDLREVGRILGVGSVVEGSVRRAGNLVRVTAQLLDARTDKHLWAANYDRDLRDIFKVQSELATEIARVRRDRCATAIDELEIGLASLAAPVADGIAALSISGPTLRLDAQRMADLQPTLIHEAEALGRDMGVHAA